MRKQSILRTLFLTATTVASALGASAHAVDLRSWDQRIEDPAKRFVVLAIFNNQAVLDKETQLVWQRTPVSYGASWTDAANQCVSAGIGNRYGWRLPTIAELSSLAGVGGVLPVGHPFTGIQGNLVFWSGTGAANGASAYARLLTQRNAYPQPKVSQLSWLCVRGHGGAESY